MNPRNQLLILRYKHENKTFWLFFFQRNFKPTAFLSLPFFFFLIERLTHILSYPAVPRLSEPLTVPDRSNIYSMVVSHLGILAVQAVL